MMSIKKDLKFRDDQSKRGETTYSVDAEIRGSLSEIVHILINAGIIGWETGTNL